VAGIKLNSIYEGQMLPDVTFDKVDPRILELDEKKEQGELWTDSGMDKLKNYKNGILRSFNNDCCFSEVLEAMQRHLPHIADVGVKFISFYALLWKDIVRTHMPDCRRMLKFENLAINPEHTRSIPGKLSKINFLILQPRPGPAVGAPFPGVGPSIRL
jgi:hypothetical protein